jgi:hypothetical protein
MITARRHVATKVLPAWLMLLALTAARCAGGEPATPVAATTPAPAQGVRPRPQVRRRSSARSNASWPPCASLTIGTRPESTRPAAHSSTIARDCSTTRWAERDAPMPKHTDQHQDAAPGRGHRKLLAQGTDPAPPGLAGAGRRR